MADESKPVELPQDVLHSDLDAGELDLANRIASFIATQKSLDDCPTWKVSQALFPGAAITARFERAYDFVVAVLSKTAQ